MTFSIFRPEALAQRDIPGLGPIVMNLPVSHEAIGWVAMLFFVCLALFLRCVSFSEQVIVPGYVDVKPGVVAIYPKRSGVILKKYVILGQQVKQGQVLFVIRTGFDRLQKQESDVLGTFEGLEKSLLRDIQKRKVDLARLRQLVAVHYVSSTEYEQQRRALLNTTQQAVELRQSRMKLKLDQAYVVVAPITGEVASLPMSVGEFLKGDKPLVKLIPHHAKWIVRLLVPTQLIRFVKRQASTRLRYDAYPFRRFGTDEGQIDSLSQTAWMADEQQHPIKMRGPYYQVEVALSSVSHVLKQGMTLSAVLKGEKRTVWQWMKGWV